MRLSVMMQSAERCASTLEGFQAVGFHLVLAEEPGVPELLVAAHYAAGVGLIFFVNCFHVDIWKGQ